MHEAMRIAFDNDNAGQAEKQMLGVFCCGSFKNAVIHQHLLKMQIIVKNISRQVIFSLIYEFLTIRLHFFTYISLSLHPKITIKRSKI